MEVLAENNADLSERGAPSRATEISLSEAQLLMGEPVTVRVWDDDGSTSFDVDFELRPVVYRASDDTELVSVMGAVFRVQSEGGVVVREWSPVLQDDRAMVPILNTSSATGGSQATKSSTVLVRTNARNRTVRVATGEYDQTWRMSVDSPRASLWARMLEEHSGVDCTVSGGVAECAVSGTPEELFVVETRATVEIGR
jgi:hypothetical protein